MLLQGVAHVHSTYSYDGCHPLRELVDFFRSQRLDFVLMSEHNRGLSEGDMKRIVADCDALSDDGFLVVPGLECEATPDYVHILAYGVRTLIRARHATEICGAIAEAGGLPALAHPGYRDGFGHLSSQALDRVEGWEVWNGKADGRWFPSVESTRRLSRLQVDHPHLLPLAGADLHRLESYPGIKLQIECGRKCADDLIAALRQRRYHVVGQAFQFSASDSLRLPRMAMARTMSVVLPRFKRLSSRADRWLSKRGASMPESVYRFARRILR